MKITGKKKSTPKIAKINELEENGLKNVIVDDTLNLKNEEIKKLKKKIKELISKLNDKEQLTETEQEVFSDIIEGRLVQYPLITKSKKNPHKYAKTHKRTASLKKKFIRMGLLPHD